MKIREILQQRCHNQDILLILKHITNYSHARLIACAEEELSGPQLECYYNIMMQLNQGIPLPYILQKQYFYEHSFYISPDVLIPRPDTERLVELAIKIILESAAAPERSGNNLRILELGTGSGCIAISIEQKIRTLLPENFKIEIIATDISSAALKIAQVNQARLDSTISLLKSDWYSNLPHPNSDAARFDLIVSNPPYLAPNDPHLQGLTSEPQLALVAPEQGLFYLKHIINTGQHYLRPEGTIALEHGYNQFSLVQQMMQQINLTDISLVYDYGTNPRVTYGKKSH